MPYLCVMLGSALGGLLRYLISRWMLPLGTFPYGTVLINVLGSFVIGYFGTLTLQSGKYPASENVRLFVMIGVCGGFTTFSSFSLQTFDMMRGGSYESLMKALANVVVSVVLCVSAVGFGHWLAQQSGSQTGSQVAIAETVEEEYTG